MSDGVTRSGGSRGVERESGPASERQRKENVSRLSSTLARPDRGRVRPWVRAARAARDAGAAAGGRVVGAGIASQARTPSRSRLARGGAGAWDRASARGPRRRYGAWGKQTPPRELENRVPCRAGFNRVGTLSGGPDAETDRHSIDEDARSTRGRRRRDRGGVRGREPRARPRGPPSGYTGSGPVWRTRYAPSAARGRRRRGRRPWRPPRCCVERSCRSEPRRGRGAQSCRSERGRPWFPVCAVRVRNRDRARAAETVLSHSLHSWRRCLDSSPVQCSREAIAGRKPVQTLNGTNRHRQTVRTRSRLRDFFPSIARTATMSAPETRSIPARVRRAREEGQPKRARRSRGVGSFRDAQTACGARHARARRTTAARATARARSLRGV